MIISALPVEQNVAMVKLFEDKFGQAPRGFAALPMAGSSRKYIRLFGEQQSAIGVWGKDPNENSTFIRWATIFKEHGVQVPEIFGEALEQGVYLQEDLGDSCLLDIRLGEPTKALGPGTLIHYQNAIDQLINIQKVELADTKADWFYPEASFGLESILNDLRYGQYYFIKPMGISFSTIELEKDFRKLAERASAEKQVLMIRDFQARNLMVKDGKIICIDFQGLRAGPRFYDLISLLYQAKANLTEEDRQQLLKYYEANSNGAFSLNEESTKQSWQIIKLIRFMQVLGAYGYRGLFEKKPHFLASIPNAVGNIRNMLNADFDFSAYPELHKVLLAVARVDILPFIQQVDKPDKLNIRITSFSFRKGPPVDPSGNGGGFIFDCRFVYNPGRQAKYRSLSGLDEPVQRFLLEETEMPGFIDEIEKMVTPAVDKYLSRDFQNLMISFGCTGGQHRSVFAAETIAERLRQREGVNVIVKHRERRNWPALA